jgi:regulatory protein
MAIELSAIKLLAGREHSRQELSRKLRARNANAGQVDSVLDDLERRGLLSDERFTETYVDQRSRKGYGPLRIRAELAERGVQGELVTRWLDEGGHDWSEVLADTAARKFGGAPVSDRRTMAKRGRFLQQRGFPISLVRRYLDRVREF